METDPEFVRRWVVERGLAGPKNVRVVPLDGGVSCEVFSVSDRQTSLVVKHAGPSLRVAATWLADPRRVIHEGEVLGAFARMTPGHVPALLDIDRDRHLIAMSHAPTSWVPWKQHLIAGRTDRVVAATLGATLGTWHAATWHGTGVDGLDDYPLFEALRLDPYFVYTQTRQPQHAARLDGVVQRLRGRRLCLVHGDFSPKNVMVGDDGLWVLDFEVAHLGDPQFDLVFMLAHLTLKAVNRPHSVDGYHACAQAFLDAYRTTAPDPGQLGGPELLRLLGAMLLARVHGKSPVDYLDESGRRRTVELAEALLYDVVDDLDGHWELVRGGARSLPTR